MHNAGGAHPLEQGLRLAFPVSFLYINRSRSGTSIRTRIKTTYTQIDNLHGSQAGEGHPLEQGFRLIVLYYKVNNKVAGAAHPLQQGLRPNVRHLTVFVSYGRSGTSITTRIKTHKEYLHDSL